MQILEAPTNHQINYVQRKINWHDDLLNKMKKTSHKAKTTQDKFQVTTPKNLQIKNKWLQV